MRAYSFSSDFSDLAGDDIGEGVDQHAVLRLLTTGNSEVTVGVRLGFTQAVLF